MNETSNGRVVTLVGFDPLLEFVVATALKDHGHAVGSEILGRGPVEDTVHDVAAGQPDVVVLGPALGPAAEQVAGALWAAPETRHLPVLVVGDGGAPLAGETAPPNVRAFLAPPFDPASLLEALEALAPTVAASAVPGAPRGAGARPARHAGPRTPSIAPADWAAAPEWPPLICA
jgi:hypothetical protein